jgi:hypothetical protein
MWNYFLSMLMLVFSIASIVAGIFTTYFGSGRSKAVGAILVIIGLVVMFLFLWFAGVLSFLGTAPISWVGQGVVLNGVVAVIGAIVGAGMAVALFLMSIMKA